MIPAVTLLLVLLAPASAATTTLLDQPVPVGAGKIRTLDVHVPHAPARIVCRYSVINGAPGARLLFLTRHDAERMSRGLSHRLLASTPYAPAGSLSALAPAPGHYRLVLDNRDTAASSASVQLRVELVRGESARTGAAHPLRAQIVVWSSAAFFLAVFSWAGLRIRRAVERQRENQRHFYF